MMQNRQKIYEEVFGEIKNILEDLSKSESYEVFLSKENEINILYQKFSFLKISQEFDISSTENFVYEQIENQETNSNSETEIEGNLKQENNIEEIIIESKESHDIFENVPEVEEVHSFAEIEEAEHLDENGNPVSENILADNSPKLEPMQDSRFSFAMEKEEHHDKRFKLANIKGLKMTKSLFDDDPLENEEHQPISSNAGSLLKNNVPTDFMEAPKPKPEFKLDLNDRIAFSQYLFGGSQSELNEVVTRLNSYNDLEQAKEFLSELYYKNNWEKADAYAQRLWVLVENRFL